MSDYAGVILAAGQGKRMGALGKEYPKTLLPVGDEPVIGHQLRMFNRLGVKEVYVVIGHLGTKVSEVVGTGSDYGVAIQYIEQGPPLGSAFALGRLKSVISRPFLVTLGDYYFEITDAERMIDRLENKVSAISAKYERDYNLLREGCELRVSSHSRLEGIVEKPSAPSGNLKGCGFYAFQPTIMDSIARTPRTALRDEYELSVSLDIHLTSGEPIYVEAIIEADWNLTRARDVLDCNLHWLRGRQEQTFLAPGARIVDGALLKDVVVGAGAYVGGAACVRRGVIFPNARLESGDYYESVLVTPTGPVQV